MVYVGGAVVNLYIDDTSAEDVLQTKDIDITLEILSLGELEKLRQLLNQKGFYQTAEDNVICRFRFEETALRYILRLDFGDITPYIENLITTLSQFDYGFSEMLCHFDNLLEDCRDICLEHADAG